MHNKFKLCWSHYIQGWAMYVCTQHSWIKALWVCIHGLTYLRLLPDRVSGSLLTVTLSFPSFIPHPQKPYVIRAWWSRPPDIMRRTSSWVFPSFLPCVSLALSASLSFCIVFPCSSFVCLYISVPLCLKCIIWPAFITVLGNVFQYYHYHPINILFTS